jgi:hypothetical protein
MANVRTRFWIEAGLAVISLLLLVVTLISREWIEIVFGVDPDHGSGSLEWLIVAIAALVTAFFSVIARMEWRRGSERMPGRRSPAAD